MNHITLSGNLTREPEVRAINNSDYSVIAFGLANNDQRKKTAEGAFESIASFYDCEYWTKNPQHWLAQLRKGIGVVIEGQLLQDRWEQDGQNRSKHKIKLTAWPLVLSGKDEQQASSPAPVQQAGPEQFDSDEIPF